jgi:hypothetical protein
MWLNKFVASEILRKNTQFCQEWCIFQKQSYISEEGITPIFQADGSRSSSLGHHLLVPVSCLVHYFETEGTGDTLL